MKSFTRGFTLAFAAVFILCLQEEPALSGIMKTQGLSVPRVHPARVFILCLQEESRIVRDSSENGLTRGFTRAVFILCLQEEARIVQRPYFLGLVKTPADRGEPLFSLL